MNKILVSYFSASGNTRMVAQHIADAVNGDLFEIEPVVKYTSEDLDWNNSESRTSIEMKDKSSRPEILRKVENIDDYDTIIIGFPVWWYSAPTIINTFIESNNLAGKNIYVFVTSGGSSEIDSFNYLKDSYPNLKFISARRFRGNENDEDYKSWIGLK